MTQVWFIFSGTIVNSVTVIVGSLAGIFLSAQIPERYRTIILSSLGLVTLALGVDAAVLRFADTVGQYAPLVEGSATYGARLAMVMIACLIIGGVLGTAMRLHQRIESMGRWIHGRFSDQDGHAFAEGFLSASVIFCVGPLTLLGCLQNGAHGDPSFLYVKSALDAFCSMALASSLGWGVLGSVLTVILFQGGLSFLAYHVAEPLDPVSLMLMTAVGGLVMLALSLMLLEIKRLPVADMLPGIFLPPLAVWLVELIRPGLLLPSAA